MKKLKLLAAIACLLFALAIVVYFVKQPKYSIKTEGELYVVNKASSTVTVFDLNKGAYLKEIPIQEEPHEATVLANSNKVIVTNYGALNVNGKSLSVLNTDNKTVEKVIDIGESFKPHGIISLPNTNKVAVVTDVGNDLVIVNVDTGKVEKQIPTQQDFSHLLVKHPNKPIMFVANINSGSVSVIDIEEEKVIKIISIGEKAEGIDINHDGTEIWATNIKDNFIAVIDTETYEITKKINTGKLPLRLKFSNDGKYCLVSNAGDGNITVYDSHTKQPVTNIDIPGKKNILEKVIYRTPKPVGILMHPNGSYAFVSNLNPGRVEVINMNSFSIVSSIKVGEMPDGLALIN